jgi:hypothetical protein
LDLHEGTLCLLEGLGILLEGHLASGTREICRLE